MPSLYVFLKQRSEGCAFPDGLFIVYSPAGFEGCVSLLFFTVFLTRKSSAFRPTFEDAFFPLSLYCALTNKSENPIHPTGGKIAYTALIFLPASPGAAVPYSLRLVCRIRPCLITGVRFLLRLTGYLLSTDRELQKNHPSPNTSSKNLW